MTLPRMRSLLLGLVMAIAAVIGSALPAQALSGTQYNNTDPIATGCTSAGYRIANRPILDSNSRTVSYMEVYFSTRCGTNWIRVTGNPYGGAQYKLIQSATGNDMTIDPQPWGTWYTGSSYGRQIYAPGCIDVRVELYPQYGVVGGTAFSASASAHLC